MREAGRWLCGVRRMSARKPGSFDSPPERSRFSLGWMIGLVAIGCIVDPATVHAADLQQCRQLLITGQYRECIGTAGTAIEGCPERPMLAKCWPLVSRGRLGGFFVTALNKAVDFELPSILPMPSSVAKERR